MERIVGIYCIESTKSGKKYVGSSKNLLKRLANHKASLNSGTHYNKALQTDFTLVQGKDFTFTCICTCEENELLFKEEFFIKFLEAEYNIIQEPTTYKHPEELKKRHSATKKRLYKEGKLEANNKRQIDVYTMGGKFLSSYDSIEKASLDINIPRGDISKVLNKVFNHTKGFIFKDKDSPLLLSDIIFSSFTENIVVYTKETSEKIYFRSYKTCADYFDVKWNAIRKFILISKNTKFKKQYNLDLVKSCELLEQLEVANQQPSDIEIY